MCGWFDFWEGLALTAALVAGVERMGLTVLYEKDLFHGATEGANGNSDEFEALDFSGRIDCVCVPT
jgi:hypothetical protein